MAAAAEAVSDPAAPLRFRLSAGRPDPTVISAAAKCLRRGGLVVFPTETVYGVGVNANDQEAVHRLYEIKGRPDDKPFTWHLPDVERAHRLPVCWTQAAEELVQAFWPGPLTVVLARTGGGTLGLRVPDHPVAQALLAAAGVPVAASSANPSGAPPPATADEAEAMLAGGVDCILDAGPTDAGQASTVVDCTDPVPKIVRPGARAEEIQDMVEEAKRRYLSTHVESTIMPAQVRRILCVCTGNSCRSVMAEWLLRKLLADGGRQDIQVLSAGLGTPGGFGPTPETVEVMRHEGIDVTGHLSTPVSSEIIVRSDLVLVMDQYHRSTILAKHPEVESRMFLLKEFLAPEAPADPNIADPIGRPLEVYEGCLMTIKEAIDRVAAWLTK